MKRVALCGLLLGCSTPTPTLHIALAGPPTQACPSTDCAMVPMTCASVLSLRILDPDAPNTLLIDQCAPVELDGKRDVCELARINLDSTKLPVKTLDVQMAVYPTMVLPTDPMTGAPQCPATIKYDTVWGFPVSQNPTPALGGHAFYHPGDSDVVVTLGCTDLSSINDASCAAPLPLMINATVDDFETLGTSVAPNVADRLLVYVGEPHPGSSVFELNPNDATALDRTVIQPLPAWAKDVDATFKQAVCLEVLEDGAQSTATLRCRPATAATRYDLAGVRLAKATLSEILGTLQMAAFPDEGLTIGIVVDQLGSPVANYMVRASNGTVQYLSADRKSVIAGNSTSTSGIWVSRDAQFGTKFTTGLGAAMATGIGGLVAGKVTVVVLQLAPSTM